MSDSGTLSRKTASIKEISRAKATTAATAASSNGKKAVSLALSVDAYKKILDRKRTVRKSVREVVGELSERLPSALPAPSAKPANKDPAPTAPSSLSATPILPRRQSNNRGDVCSLLLFVFMFF